MSYSYADFVKTMAPPNWSTPTQSDTVADPVGTFTAIYVGGTGDVKVHTLGSGTAASGTDVVFKAVPVGTIIRGQFTRIWSTGTGATLMLVGY